MGAASASLLARAGVGTLTLIDRDFVEPSNLQRQVLFDEADARDTLPKAEAARRHIALFNSRVTVHARIADLTPSNIAELLSLLTDPAPRPHHPRRHRQLRDPLSHQRLRRPARHPLDLRRRHRRLRRHHEHPARSQLERSIHGAVSPRRWTSLSPTACLACIFPKPPTGNVETCDTAGILATAVNLAASIQVTEALKFLTGQPHLMRRTLLSFDLWNPVERNPKAIDI